MDKPAPDSQENQPDITAAIARLQTSVDKLQSILTNPQAQAEAQTKIAASAEQAMARLQAKLASGQLAMFSPFPQSSGIPAFINPYNTASMRHAAALSASKALNNASASTVQKEVMEVLEALLNNPHRSEMEDLALQTVVDIANNPHWDQANALVADCLADAMKNPWMKSKLPERLVLVDDPEWLPLNSEEHKMATGLAEAIKRWRHQKAIDSKNIDFNEVFSIDEQSCYRYQKRLESGPSINMSEVLDVIKEITTLQEVSRNDLFGGFYIDASSVADHASRLMNAEELEKNNLKVDWELSEHIIRTCRNENLCPLSLNELDQAKLAGEFSKENIFPDKHSELWKNFFDSMLVGWIGSTNKFFLSELVSQAMLKQKYILQCSKEQQSADLSSIVEKLTHRINGTIDVPDNTGSMAGASSYKNSEQPSSIDFPHCSREDKTP